MAHYCYVLEGLVVAMILGGLWRSQVCRRFAMRLLREADRAGVMKDSYRGLRLLEDVQELRQERSFYLGWETALLAVAGLLGVVYWMTLAGRI